MGLGGYLTWTALAREIYENYRVKCIPLELHGSMTRLIKSPIFYNNPHFLQQFSQDLGVQLQLNSPAANYCQLDTPDRAVHKSDKHIIETLCDVYGIHNPTLKCEIFLDHKEKKEIEDLSQNLPENFITIEPHSNFDYTVNRQYPVSKWQKVVQEVSKCTTIVQLGMSDAELLDGVIDFRGKTTFRTAAGLISRSKLLLSNEGGLTHACTAFHTPAVVILTGYQTKKMVAYPQNIYVDISSHGPCGMKIACQGCVNDANDHDVSELIEIILGALENRC